MSPAHSSLRLACYTFIDMTNYGMVITHRPNKTTK